MCRKEQSITLRCEESYATDRKQENCLLDLSPQLPLPRAFIVTTSRFTELGRAWLFLFTSFCSFKTDSCRKNREAGPVFGATEVFNLTVNLLWKSCYLALKQWRGLRSPVLSEACSWRWEPGPPLPSAAARGHCQVVGGATALFWETESTKAKRL